jgi:dihydroorotase
MGMLGLETALSVVQQVMVDTGRMSWGEVADRMSTRPARIGRVDGHGRGLVVGAPANVTVVDPSTSWTVEPHALASKSRNTPYRQMTLPGSVYATFLRGNATVLDGKLA